MSALETASHSALGNRALRRFSPLFAVLVGLTMATVTLSSSEASAARVLNFENVPITAKLSVDQVKKGIIKAGMPRGWKMKESGPGELTALIHVRTHTAIVTINYSAESYSITYKDSTNLKYKNGKIHRAYNNWVTNLKNDIDLELSF
jgi:hypothetical protein